MTGEFMAHGRQGFTSNPKRRRSSSHCFEIPWRIPQVGSDMLADMSDTDLELLARYTSQQSEDAFAEIVRRRLGLVYSAALRQVRSPQLAEEVAQSVFIDLARNATKLKPDTILTAWLYQVTRRTAIDVVRREASRQLREQIATEMNAMNATAADWTHIEPLLDEAMHALDDTDRAAVLLRYFENKSLREVGVTLGTSENAAQKRLGRAVERLREFFAQRGVTVGASGLVVVISANAVQAAPVGLAVTILTAPALAGTTTIITAAKLVAMTTVQKILVASILTVAVAFGTYKVRQTSDSRKQVAAAQPSLAATNRAAVPASGMITTVSGLKYQVLRQGVGTMSPTLTDTVRVHYHGTLLDGTVFDSSMDRGRPKSFPVDSVIAGWTEGIQLMKVGDTFKFEIPPHLGYGVAKSKNANIPPNSTLVFEVELLDIQ
jgi:RNA polymerase sigma factor (sigma-70 family)